MLAAVTHRERAAAALGKPLPAGAEVHHHTYDGHNSQLVICQDSAYHHLLHSRMRRLGYGRPVLANQFNIRFSPEEAKALRTAAANESDGNVAVLIRRWIRRWLRKRGLLNGTGKSK